MTNGKSGLSSAIYKGHVRHRRFTPVTHEFEYPLFMLYLDLDELPQILKPHWFASWNRLNLVSLKRDDYFNPQTQDLKQAVMDEVLQYAQAQGVELEKIDRVMMLTHARYFNVIFNPVTFYYCFDKDNQLIAIQAEITNTPWGQRHSYVMLPGHAVADKHYQAKHKHHEFQFDKAFHVSPFNPMDMQYRWVVSPPDSALHIHMDNTQGQGQDIEKHFDATLSLTRYEWQSNFAKTLIHYPFMTVKVMWGIYWQALKLWLKRAPFYDHPDTVLNSDVQK